MDILFLVFNVYMYRLVFIGIKREDKTVICKDIRHNIFFDINASAEKILWEGSKKCGEAQYNSNRSVLFA